MSLVHLDKSVLTFHFKEILEDGHLGGPLTLIGLSALIFGPKLLSNLTVMSSRTAKPRVKASVYRPHISLSEWVVNARQQQGMSSQELSAIDAAEAQGVVSAPENPMAIAEITA